MKSAFRVGRILLGVARLSKTVVTVILFSTGYSHAKLAVSTATTNSITLNWTAPGDDDNSGTAAQYDIRYSTAVVNESNWASASQVAGEPEPQVAGSAETFTVSGLEPGTLYYFAIKSSDEIPNWSALSNVISRATDQETVAPAAVANLLINSTASTSVSLTWTAPGDDGSVGTASQYDIRYATDSATLAAWDAATQVSGEPVPSVAGSTESFTVTGLTASTKYYFAVKTADNVPNWSTVSNIVNTTTGVEQIVPSTIANLTVILPTQSSLTLIWTAPGDDGSVGTASQYDLRYSTSAITTANWASATAVTNEPVPSPAGTPETLTVANLVPSTTYYFAIKTADEVPNWSALSNVASGNTSTDQTAPAAIDDLQASSGDDMGEIDLSWTAPGDDGTVGTATVYEILYSREQITEQNIAAAEICTQPPVPAGSGTVQTFTLCQLSPGEQYYVAIRTYDEAANPSPLSNVDSSIANLDIITDADDDNIELPATFGLSQNYPNPFNPNTQIEFALPQACHVTLEIFNINGQRVATLVDGQLPAGEHTVEWDGVNNSDQLAASGVYLYHLQAGAFSDARKMVLTK